MGDQVILKIFKTPGFDDCGMQTNHMLLLMENHVTNVHLMMAPWSMYIADRTGFKLKVHWTFFCPFSQGIYSVPFASFLFFLFFFFDFLLAKSWARGKDNVRAKSEASLGNHSEKFKQ